MRVGAGLLVVVCGLSLGNGCGGGPGEQDDSGSGNDSGSGSSLSGGQSGGRLGRQSPRDRDSHVDERCQ
jgi:uncharacterized spore protein YtfJ